MSGKAQAELREQVLAELRERGVGPELTRGQARAACRTVNPWVRRRLSSGPGRWDRAARLVGECADELGAPPPTRRSRKEVAEARAAAGCPAVPGHRCVKCNPAYADWHRAWDRRRRAAAAT